MGYANPDQVGTGLRQRLYARTFIIGDPDSEADRFAYMILDTQSGDTAIRFGILDGLAALGPDFAVYGHSNVAVTGTHSHSGPAAWLNYLLPQVTSKGFSKQSWEAIVNGSVLSIKRAHESLALGTLSYGTIRVEDGNINRSPYAYMRNHAKERANYIDDVDKIMTMLKFTRCSDSKDMGILTWFPTHGTSMLGNNTLVSGDNKGVAADLFEKSVRGSDSVTSTFVAGFSQSNVGDTTPNVLGAYCEDGPGEECSYEQSLCGGTTKACHGRGPNFTASDNGASSCYEIGRRQFAAASSLYSSWSTSSTPIMGTAVRSFHTFKNMTDFTFPLPNGTIVSTCAAALGYSFAAGTSDGPGAFDFKQSQNDTDPKINPVWYAVRNFLHKPTEEQIACQAPKPILLDAGNTRYPYTWAPNIADIQMLRVGQLFFIVSPGEATTMSGRRWKSAIKETVADARLTDDHEPLVVLGGPANSYTHYIATEEEYSVQRYEGASTLYGPHTLNAYINLTTSLLPYLANDRPETMLDPGEIPENNVERSLSFITGVAFDRAPFFRSFGDVLEDVPGRVRLGQSVEATFAGANPRNDLRLENTYAAIEVQTEDGRWVIIRDDSDWDLIFNWKRTSSVLGTSQVTIQWNIPDDGSVETGRMHRIRYYGASKTLVSGGINQFEGTSGSFGLV